MNNAQEGDEETREISERALGRIETLFTAMMSVDIELLGAPAPEQRTLCRSGSKIPGLKKRLKKTLHRCSV